MDSSTFDDLTARIGNQTTRRAALVTFLAGTLSLATNASAGATDRAERRRKRKKRQRREDNKTSASIFKRGISFVIDNTQGNHTLIVETGEVIHQTRCCEGLAAFTIPAGETRLFDTSSDQAYAWIDNAYWIEFFNPFIGAPWVSAAVGGMADANARCCKPGARTVVDERNLAEGDGFGFALNTQEFYIHRNSDKPDFKYFTLEVR